MVVAQLDLIQLESAGLLRVVKPDILTQLETTGLLEGTAAGRSNTTGDQLDCSGFSSRIFNTTGSSWIAQGYAAGYSNTGGNNWIAQGYTAGYSNTGAKQLDCSGFSSRIFQHNWKQGLDCSGFSSGYSNTTGSSWIAQGFQAARYAPDGTTAAQFFRSGVYIGAGTWATNGTSTALTTNECVIGYQAIGLGSNTSVIGNTSATQTHLFGNTTIGGTQTAFTAAARLHVRGSNSSSGTSALLVENSDQPSIYKIENNGKISYWATNTASGTTDCTNNKPTFRHGQYYCRWRIIAYR
jgi:hypothetical protein